MISKVRNAKMQKLAKKKHDEGIYLSNVRSYLSIFPYERHIKTHPINVIKLGAR
jgi:hypothetical protein